MKVLQKLYHHGSRMIVLLVMLVIGGYTFLNLIQDPLHNWFWILLALIYTITINDIFVHRICAHGMFKVNTSSIVYKILTFLASVDLGYGPVRQTVLSHTLHHIHSDKDKHDIMNWRFYWYSTAMVSPFPRFNYELPKNYKQYKNRMYKKFQNIFDDKWTLFCDKNAVLISVCTQIILFSVFPIFLFNVLLTGRFLLTCMTGIAGIAGHVKHFPLSYRNVDTDDTSSNNLLFHYLFLGYYTGMLQNNHHAYPNAIEPNRKWFEIDTSKPTVTMLKKLMEENNESK